MSIKDAMDFEDGLTFSGLLTMNIEIGRLCMVEQKRMFDSVHFALLSLFDSKVGSSFRDSIKDALERSNPFVDRNETKENRTPLRDRKTEQALRSVRELNKLNVLLG